MIRPSIAVAILLAAIFSASPSVAGTHGDELTKCMLQSWTAENQATFKKWAFSMFAQDPVFVDLPHPSQAQTDELAKKIVGDLERLIMVNCRKEATAALKNEGPTALSPSLRALSQSMGQSWSDNVSQSLNLAGVLKFMDRSKWRDLYKEAGVDNQQ